MENLCGLSENIYKANNINKENQMTSTQKGSNKVASKSAKSGGIRETADKTTPSQGEIVKPNGQAAK